MHAHHHAHPPDYNRAFQLGVALNVGFILLEVVFGLLADSLALLADAGHNLSDVLGLLLAWGAAALARRAATERYTYGWRKSSILAALFNALFLMAAVGAIGWEALGRFKNPSPVDGLTVVWVAAVGVAVNGFTALLFVSGRRHDLNIRAAFLHMAADAGVSLGVAAAGAAIAFSGWLWLDPAITLAIVGVIIVGTWGLLKDAFGLAVDAVPRHIDPREVQAYLAGLSGVVQVHDLHIWGLSTTEAALTAHVVKDHEVADDTLLVAIRRELHARFGIDHMTIQWERGAAVNGCGGGCAPRK